MTAERRRVHFSGDVQGVGFRWTTRRIAADHPVTGFVENLSDGRVRCEVEGTPAAIDAFLEAVREHLAGHIHEVEEERLPATGRDEGFAIAP